MKRFKVGDKVKITGVGDKWNGKYATIEKIDGAYIYIRPRWYKHQIEVYECEIEYVDDWNDFEWY